MDRIQYRAIQRGFFQYANGFLKKNADIRPYLVMKLKHSIFVAREMETLAVSLNLKETDVCMARVLGLLHDIGRFEQYVKYRTFFDSLSVDHGDLGARILRETGLLAGIDENRQTIIDWAIRHHNQARLPEDGNPRHLFFGRMIRDADKLDIYRITLSYACNWPSVDEEIFGRKNPDPKAITPEVADAMRNHRIVDSDFVRTANDLLLLRIGWVFDINFKPTFRLIKGRGYLDMLCRLLPSTGLAISLAETALKYLEEKAVE